MTIDEEVAAAADEVDTGSDALQPAMIADLRARGVTDNQMPGVLAYAHAESSAGPLRLARTVPDSVGAGQRAAPLIRPPEDWLIIWWCHPNGSGQSGQSAGVGGFTSRASSKSSDRQPN